jgi:hypothetical protein
LGGGASLNLSNFTIPNPGSVINPFVLCETFNNKMTGSVYALSLFVFVGLFFYVLVLPFLLACLGEGNFKGWMVYLGKVFLSVLFVCAGLLFMIIKFGGV